MDNWFGSPSSMRDLEVQNLWPSYLAVTMIPSVEHTTSTPSKFGFGRFTVREGLVAVVKVLCVKTHYCVDRAGFRSGFFGGKKQIQQRRFEF